MENKLEEILGKLVSEDMIKSLAETITKSDDDEPIDDSWVWVDLNKPVNSWMVIRVDTCDSIATCKKKLMPFLKAQPEGRGVVFLPANCVIDTWQN
jgi:hypothetical protein